MVGDGEGPSHSGMVGEESHRPLTVVPRLDPAIFSSTLLVAARNRNVADAQ
jgi:hypothetical protein